MTTDDYRRALATAIREYETLGQQRQDIDKRLSEVMQTIGTLSRLCGLVPTVPLGLTDACRLVVRGAGVPVTPTDVRQRLQSIGFDLSKYGRHVVALGADIKAFMRDANLEREAMQATDEPEPPRLKSRVTPRPKKGRRA